MSGTAARSALSTSSSARSTSAYCKHGHERTPENTRTNGKGATICVDCQRDASRRSYERKCVVRPRTPRPDLVMGGLCGRNHLLTPENTFSPGPGLRVRCRDCQRQTRRARAAAKAKPKREPKPRPEPKPKRAATPKPKPALAQPKAPFHPDLARWAAWAQAVLKQAA